MPNRRNIITGTDIVSMGGTVSDAHVLHGGTLVVLSGGTANGIVVYGGGLVEFEGGAIIGGVLNAARGAAVDVLGGSSTLLAPVANAGVIEVESAATLTVRGNVANYRGTLFANGGTLDIVGVVNGGVAEVGNGVVEIAGSSRENVNFQSTGSGGLQLGGLKKAYTGRISGFGAVGHANSSQFIDFAGVNFASASVTYTAANAANTSGTLSVTDGTHSASVTLVGNYVTSDFQKVDDDGTLEIIDPSIFITATTIAKGKAIVASNSDIIAESTVAVSSGGTLEAENTDGIDVEGALTNSGTTETTGASYMNLESTVSNTGDLDALNESDITIEGALTNSASVVTNGTALIVVQGAFTNSGSGFTEVFADSVLNAESNITNYGTIDTELYGQVFLDDTGTPTDTLIKNYGDISATDSTRVFLSPGEGTASTGLINYGIIETNYDIDWADNDALIVVYPVGAFTNYGTIEANVGLIVLAASVDNLGTIAAIGNNASSGEVLLSAPLYENLGVLKVTNTGYIDAAELANGGYAQINGGGSLTNYIGGTLDAIDRIEFDGSSSVNVLFGAGDSGVLSLGDAANYTGNITGFTLGDGIDLNLPYSAGDTVQYLSNYNNVGTLQVSNSSNVEIDQFTLIGLDPATDAPYTSSSFNLVEDSFGDTLIEDPSVTVQKPGNAPAAVGDGAIFEINRPDSGNVTFTGSTGKLVLDQPATFTGKVKDFGAQNGIDLSQIAFGANVTLGFSENYNQTVCTVTVTDDSQAASIALLGNYMAASFVTAPDGHGGTLITEAAASQPSLTAAHKG